MPAARPIPLLAALLILVSALGIMPANASPGVPIAPNAATVTVVAQSFVYSAGQGVYWDNFTLNLTWNLSVDDINATNPYVLYENSFNGSGDLYLSGPTCTNSGGTFSNGLCTSGVNINGFGGLLPNTNRWRWASVPVAIETHNATDQYANWTFGIGSGVLVTLGQGPSCSMTVVPWTTDFNLGFNFLRSPALFEPQNPLLPTFAECGPSSPTPPTFLRATTQDSSVTSAQVSGPQVAPPGSTIHVNYQWPLSTNDSGNLTYGFDYPSDALSPACYVGQTSCIAQSGYGYPLPGANNATLDPTTQTYSLIGTVLVPQNGAFTLHALVIAVNASTAQRSVPSCVNVILAGYTTGLVTQCPSGGVDAAIPLNPTLPFIDVNATGNITGWTPEIVSLVFMAGFAVAVTMITWTMGPFAVGVGLVLSISLFMAQGVIPTWVYVLLFTSALVALVFLKRNNGGGAQ